jgi:hypothetical protein
MVIWPGGPWRGNSGNPLPPRPRQQASPVRRALARRIPNRQPRSVIAVIYTDAHDRLVMDAIASTATANGPHIIDIRDREAERAADDIGHLPTARLLAAAHGRTGLSAAAHSSPPFKTASRAQATARGMVRHETRRQHVSYPAANRACDAQATPGLPAGSPDHCPVDGSPWRSGYRGRSPNSSIHQSNLRHHGRKRRAAVHRRQLRTEDSGDILDGIADRFQG